MMKEEEMKRRREEWVRRRKQATDSDALEDVKDRIMGSLAKKCTE